MGIPMWREPSTADVHKSAIEKDRTAAARSTIGRRGSSRHGISRARRNVMASFQSQIIDELRRGSDLPRRSPVQNNGMSEDGMTLAQAQREAFRGPSSRPNHRQRADQSLRESQALTELLGRPGFHASSYRNGSPSFTPNFAPAAAYHTRGSLTPSSDGMRLPPLRRTDSPSDEPSFFMPSSLIRINRHAAQPTRLNRETAMDGLGDRQRSLSPDGDRDTIAWESLLSTITPDANLPSNDTSFASSFASAPDVARTGTTRASTHSNLPSLSSTRNAALDPYPDHLNPCDFSSSDDEDTPVNYRRFIQPTMPLTLQRLPDFRSTQSSHPPVPTIQLSITDHNNDDLQQMQAILDRLARREDIPDDWWAAAGLARTLDRGLSASMDSTDNEGASGPNRGDL
ncbi:hypothetical protein N7508_000664 [Penicillium antarcticum]|uniref:uncharacterized protein n=1 Tax=Penicillium antarcticum TaxID=416450 RepID=UPI0023A10DA4|nr:uncharacterized protein N7508_000664 [Penicillium antarcticum]KAJ5320381.1 hypothetical protein N7508_000664 [Penicillium antarcticum]